MALDRYLTELCQAIATASSSSDLAWSLTVDADPLIISTGIAVPFALIVNELSQTPFSIRDLWAEVSKYKLCSEALRTIFQ